MDPKTYKEILEWIKSLAIAGILALVIHTFLFAVVIVSGPSMEPTLNNNERLIMNKIVYKFQEPQIGDIIVFHADEENDYIKRVIGLPGDTVEIINKQLYLNGKLASESYSTTDFIEDFEPVTVPEGKLFVLGDNRSNSKDSRAIGPISDDQVVGRVKVIIWPLNRIGSID